MNGLRTVSHSLYCSFDQFAQILTHDSLLHLSTVHPENAHAGTLLEGLSKTIDHRFYVEESDHRRLWNDNLHTYLDPNSKGRAYVAARAKQMKENGDYVDAEDLLSGGNDLNGGEAGTNEGDTDGFDLINFD